MLEKSFPLNKKWKSLQVDFVNPTSSDVTIDVFDSIILSNYPTSSSGSSYPDSVSFNTTISGASRNVVFNPTNEFIYIQRSGIAQIDVFDTVNNVIATTIVLPSTTTGVMGYCSVSNKVYVCGIGFIHVIDCATNTFLVTIVMPVITLVTGITYNSTNNSIYCTQSAANAVYRIDCTTDAIVTTLALGGGNAPLGIVYNPTTDFVYVVKSLVADIIELNPTTLVINSTTISPFTASATTPVVLCSTNNSFYYQTSTNIILEFECATLTFNANTIVFGIATVGMIFSSTNNLLYVANSFGLADDVRVYSTVDNSLVTTISTPIANYGSYAPLVYQSVKDSIYEVSDGVSILPAMYGIFEISSSSQFYISSPYDYNAIVRDTDENPMLVRRIDMVVNSQSQFTQPLNIQIRDANGNTITLPKLPNTNLSANQVQSNIVTIDFEDKEFILDDNFIFSNYTFPANTTTRMVLYYHQIKRIDIITHGLNTCSDLFKEKGVGDGYITESELQQKVNSPVVLNEEIKMELVRQKRMATKILLIKKMEEKLL